ncbi:MAG TPA: cell division protein ZipA C-terminal FtsZ-binding domain-containing protein [Burkholderiales bacterium]|nr:cell division protein ZipA C-terminal FtsZ-binding domain-containing protein [Burkholderiales bacterium]
MTDLQLGLLAIGVLAVIAVVIYNRWQERAARRDAERAFGSGHGDVLLGEDRREPTQGARKEAAPEPRRPAPTPAARLPAERVDYVIELALPKPLPPSVVHEAWSPVERRFARRALLATDQAQLRAGLQLVSRSGVVSDAELLEFRALVETMAAALGARVSAPEMREALEAARELDRTCVDADIQVALHVVGIGTAPAHFAGQGFQTIAREDGVTLTLDVARTREPRATYEAMARAGRELAQTRGGRLVDDTGRELDERALAAIGRELDAVGARLAGCGIEPGSPLALRLFS